MSSDDDCDQVDSALSPRIENKLRTDATTEKANGGGAMSRPDTTCTFWMTDQLPTENVMANDGSVLQTSDRPGVVMSERGCSKKLQGPEQRRQGENETSEQLLKLSIQETCATVVPTETSQMGQHFIDDLKKAHSHLEGAPVDRESQVTQKDNSSGERAYRLNNFIIHHPEFFVDPEFDDVEPCYHTEGEQCNHLQLVHRALTGKFKFEKVDVGELVEYLVSWDDEKIQFRVSLKVSSDEFCQRYHNKVQCRVTKSVEGDDDDQDDIATFILSPYASITDAGGDRKEKLLGEAHQRMSELCSKSKEIQQIQEVVNENKAHQIILEVNNPVLLEV